VNTEAQVAAADAALNAYVQAVAAQGVAAADQDVSLAASSTMTLRAETRPHHRKTDDEELAVRRKAREAACAALTSRVEYLRRLHPVPSRATSQAAGPAQTDPGAGALVLLRRVLHAQSQDGDPADKMNMLSTCWVGRVLGSDEPGYEAPRAQNVGGMFVQLRVADCILAHDPNLTVLPTWLGGQEREPFRFLVEATARFGWRTTDLEISECAVVHAALDALGFEREPSAPKATLRRRGSDTARLASSSGGR
jgi:hypothetical protein